MKLKAQIGLLQLLTAICAVQPVKAKPIHESHTNDRLRARRAVQTFGPRPPPAGEVRESKPTWPAAKDRENEPLSSYSAYVSYYGGYPEVEEKPHVRVKRTGVVGGKAAMANGLATSVLLLVLGGVIIVGTVITLLCKCTLYIMKCCKGKPITRPPSAISHIVPIH